MQFQLGDFLPAQDSLFQGDSEPCGLESPPSYLPPFAPSHDCPRGADVGGFMEILEQDFEQVTCLQIYGSFFSSFPSGISVFFFLSSVFQLYSYFSLSSGLTIGRLHLPPSSHQ